MATLFNYFKLKEDSLPNAEGLLSLRVPGSVISSANAEVEAVMEKTSGDETKKRTRGTYDRFTPQERAVIARSALDTGVTKTIKRYNKDLHDRKLKESTVRTWVTQYKRELELKRNTSIHLTSPIVKLENKRQGRPLLLGEELDRYTREYISELRRKGGIVNSDIVSSAAIGIVKKYDSNLLEINGGHISCVENGHKIY